MTTFLSSIRKSSRFAFDRQPGRAIQQTAPHEGPSFDPEKALKELSLVIELSCQMLRRSYGALDR